MTKYPLATDRLIVTKNRYFWGTIHSSDVFCQTSGFISISKAANKNALAQIEKLYKQLNTLEPLRKYGDAALELLESNQIKYNNLIIKITKG